MEYRKVPHFVIKRNLQKVSVTGKNFDEAVTPLVLRDITCRITGQQDFTYNYVDNDYCDDFLSKGYNKGRMAVMFYKDCVSYISFSEKEISGRNSSVQSVPTAFNLYYMNPYPNKSLYYYFLNERGNAGTNYQILMYRLMKTVGFVFLNDKESLGNTVLAFSSIEDIINSRQANTSRNRSNNSTYITKSALTQYDVYGKTYGASKYETSMLCYAISHLAAPHNSITLYEVLEGDLKKLPQASLDVIAQMPNINVVQTDITLEKREFTANNSLRSPRYIYNLLERLGSKHCALCNCEIPELIQGAHIWPVAEIKKVDRLTIEEKIQHATCGANGIWLCENHHKMFDEGLLN